MNQNFIKRFLSKIVADQLRKPSGLLAKTVGNKMNETNGFLYDFTIEIMQLRDSDSILEIGFGNGKLFNKLFSAADNLSVSGLDFSAEMVKAATLNNPSALHSGKLTLRLGSSDKIPFANNSFDKVFCINVIYFWERPDDHLKEIHRVLKPGGKFYASIREKESLKKMPFAQHGFTIYSEGDWTALLERTQLHHVGTRMTQNEPDAEFGGQQFSVESQCIVAEKGV